MLLTIFNRLRKYYIKEIFWHKEYLTDKTNNEYAAQRSGLKIGSLIRELFGAEDGKIFVEGAMSEFSTEFSLDFDYEKVQEECRWLLDERVVFADHHNWQAEPLLRIGEMKIKAHEASVRGIQDENNEFLKIPVVFIFSAGSVFIEVDQWPEDFDSDLNDYGRKELARITGLNEDDFLHFGRHTFEFFWGHKQIKPADYLKAVRLANLAARMHGNQDFQAWFNSDSGSEVEQDPESEAIAQGKLF